jgi:hypothetical protein
LVFCLSPPSVKLCLFPSVPFYLSLSLCMIPCVSFSSVCFPLSLPSFSPPKSLPLYLWLSISPPLSLCLCPFVSFPLSL